MSTVIESLHADHLRLTRVVRLLDEQAKNGLDDEDWRTIKDYGPWAQSDPLFDGEVDERFAQLYRVITAEAKAAHAEALR